MNIDSPQPNVRDLQQDVISLLDEIEDLMHRASELLSSDPSGKKYAQFQQGIKSEQQKVANLQLVMAIVAPMKAGKSTIVNAIVGQELMPSRASAMTMLPAEIVLCSDESEPVLTIDKDTRLHLQNTISTLQGIIIEKGIEEINSKIARYPHLHYLIHKIQDGISIELETWGLDEIKHVLTALNDVIRVCSVIDPAKNPLIRENLSIPCITTPFWQATDIHQSNLLGNLVIIDTPGPNEAGEKLRLNAILNEQLRKSSMVLIVLDFTQLNNQAAEKIKEQIAPIIRLLGKGNLYVLVNKVDQRTERDPMTAERVKQFVLADLGLGSGDENRVFEVAARWAFCAANFLSEIEHNPNLDKNELKTARALAEQVFGIDWEEDFEDSSLDLLQKKAQRLWRKSGFEPFLENAINVLMASAAPECIKSALNRSYKCLEELSDDVLLRSSAIAQDEKKLRLELLALEEDLNHLHICRQRLKELDSIKSKLKSKMDGLLEKLKKEAKLDLESCFLGEGSNSTKTSQQSFSGVLFSSFREFLQRFDENIKFTESGEDSGPIIEFDYKKQAEDFSSQTISYAQDRANEILLDARKDINREIREAKRNLKFFLEKETDPIIKRAQSRLNQDFNISLSLPSPILDISNDFSDSKLNIQDKSKWVPQEDDIYIAYERVWWNWLWLVPISIAKRRERPNKKVSYYIVSLEELIAKINRSLEKSANEIEGKINEYIDCDLQNCMNFFFKELDQYLSNYRSSLKQAQVDQNLAVEDKNRLVSDLNSLTSQSAQQIKKCKEYIRRAETLI